MTEQRKLPPILEFQGEHRWLSNFHPITVLFEGYMYPSAEHAYQAAKTLSAEERRFIASRPGPGAAKRAGRQVTLRDNWDEIKLQIMHDILWHKFQWPELKMKLLATGDRDLIEGNYWNDTYWGCSNGRGENHLGKILMKIRSELQKEKHEIHA